MLGSNPRDPITFYRFNTGWSIDLIGIFLTMGLLLNSPYTLGFQTPGEEVFGPQTHT